ncbi:MAG TPA: hypothetical protein DIU00_21410 [Phycisphaerales bacterium]|nr:hypothetical protein [Phycisphaerales bacterium]
MFNKLICLVSFALLLSLVGDVQADVDWTDAGPDHLWSTPTNWTTDTVPTSTDMAIINLVPGPTIAANVDAVAMAVHLGNGGSTGEMTVDGGTLILDWSHIGEDAGGYGTVYMNSGTITTGDGLTVGDWGSGTINMTGGTIRVGQTFMIAGASPTATGHVNLDGGTITAGNLVMRDDEGAVGTMDVKAGTMIIDGDAVSTVQGFINNGWITAYGGNGTLQLDYNETNEGQTTLKAIHNLKPDPADGGSTAPGEVELSWTLPDPLVPGQPVSVDVYFTDDWEALYSFTDPAAIQVVSRQNVTSVLVQTQPKKQYYWVVDTYLGGDDPNNNPFFGPIFSFVADNLPPEVDAGADVVTWLQAGARDGNLDAAVTDNDAYTVQWTVVSEPDDPNNPDVVIADPSAEDTSITLSALGEYVLQLEASDGEYTGSDTVTINVYNDGCQAAQSLPDYVPLPGDVNGDCIFDQLDLDILNEDWLKDISLTEEWFKTE